jgi:hypothetical protein
VGFCGASIALVCGAGMVGRERKNKTANLNLKKLESSSWQL